MDQLQVMSQQVPLALVLVYLHNWLKQKSWMPSIRYDTPRANHMLSIVMTGVATLGIHFTWSAQNHSLVITGLDAHTIGVGAWHWLTQYVFVKTGYNFLQGALNPPNAKLATPVVVVHDERT